MRQEPTINTLLSIIDKRLAIIEGKVEVLNAWHNQVNGALRLVTWLAGGGMGVTILMKFLGG